MKKSLSIFAIATLASLTLAGCTADADLENPAPALTKATPTAQVIFEDHFNGPGTIPDAQLPARMEVDWVKITQFN